MSLSSAPPSSSSSSQRPASAPSPPTSPRAASAAGSFHRRTDTSSLHGSTSGSTASLATDATPTPSRPSEAPPPHVGSSYRAPSTSASVTHSPTSTRRDSPSAKGIMEDADVVLSMDACRCHASPKCPKDPFARPRWEMANIHVALFNGLESIYLHAPFVSGLEARLAFAHFASSAVHSIDFHHDVEEEYYFPSLEVAISMQQNLEQHASFDDGVRALKFYLKSVIVDPTIYEATTITDIIDMFARDLACHFADELTTLDPDILRNHFTTRDLSQQGANLQKQIIKDYKRHLYTALPVIIINTPPGQAWPMLSPLVRRVILPLVLGRKFKSSWKYGKWPEQLNVFSRGGGGGGAGAAKEETIKEGSSIDFSDEKKRTMEDRKEEEEEEGGMKKS